MEFWTRLDRIVASHSIRIDRPKGTCHPDNPEIEYPLDYGYLEETSSGDGHEIDVWRGSIQETKLVGVVCTVDTRKSDTELKLLIGCTDDEINTIRRFHNNKHMSAIVIQRSN